MKLLIVVALLSCVLAGTPFLGQPEPKRNLQAGTLNELPLECTRLLQDLVITDYGVIPSGSPRDNDLQVELQLKLSENLFECNQANSNSKYENIVHKAYYMDKSNDHNNPYDNVDHFQQGCNCDSKKILTTCEDGETLATKLGSDACKAAAAANDLFINTLEIPETNQDGGTGSWWIMKKATGGSSGIAMTVVYHFDYSVYDKLIKDKFYAINTRGDELGDGEFAYEESKWAFLHEIFMLEVYNEDVDPVAFDWGLTRWWEFEMTLKFYLELEPARSEPFKVIAKEIKVPACKTCTVVWQQTATLEFVEEKDRTDTSPCPKALEVVDWEKARDISKPFCSLERVLMRVYLKNVDTPRKFVLQTFNYDYGDKNAWYEIYDRKKSIETTSLYFKTPRWNPTLKQLELEITNIQVGQSAKNLMYQAQVRLCQFDGSELAEPGTDANWSCDPVTLSTATAAEGGTRGTIGGRRMLASGGDKEVVQKYTSPATAYEANGDEASLSGGGTTTKKEEESGSPVAIIVVIVVIAACVGIGIGVYFHMKKNKGSSGGDQVENQGERA